MTQQSFFSLTQARKQMGDPKIEQLIQKAQTLVKEFKSKELELMEVLQELDQTKAYRISGFNSLYTFCTEFLNLSEHQAYHYITVSRKCQEVPLLKSALFDKKITISKARRLCAVLGKNTSEQNLQWIKTAQKSTHKELERIIRKKDPRALVPDTTRYLTDTHLKLQATVSHETYNKLQRVKEILMAQGGVDYDQVFSKMADEFLKRHDPIKKAQRWLDKENSLAKNKKTCENATSKMIPAHHNPCSSQLELGIFRVQEKSKKSPTQRTPLQARVKHQVYLRDQGLCQYVHQGKKCQSRYFIELHHQIPVSKGGRNTVENLITLCSAHHKKVHGV